MAKKGLLHLSVDNELVELAKMSGLNLSSEFEEWIKIRLGKINDEKPIIDVNKEIAKHQIEIEKLKAQTEIEKKKASIDEEKNVSLDRIIDNALKYNENLLNPDKIHGVQFIMQKKYKQFLNPFDAKELLIKRIKERGLNERRSTENQETI